MSIERYGGISCDLLLNNTTDIVKLVGSGRNNNQSGKIFINNQLSAQTVSRGLNLYVYDENLTLLESSAYDLQSTNNINAFVTKVYNILPRRYFAIISYDDIRRNQMLDDMFQSYNGDLWAEMWANYAFENPNYTENSRARLPYAAFGATHLGITHEAYGDYKPGAPNPLAELIATVGDYDRFGSTGFGRPVKTVTRKSLSSTTTTDSFTLNGYNGHFLVTVRAKSIQRNARVEIVDNPSGGSGLGTQTYTVNIDSNLFHTYTLTIPVRDPNSTYTIRQVAPSTLDIEFIQVTRTAQDNSSSERVSAIVKRNNGFSIKDIVFSNNGYDIADDTMLNNMAQDETFYLNATGIEVVGKTAKAALSFNGLQESDFIPVNEYKDYCILGFYRCPNGLTNIKITVSAYDENYDPIAVQTRTGSSTSVLVNETNMNTNDIVFFENYLLASTAPSSTLIDFSSNMYGDVEYGGYEVPFQTKNAVRMVTGVRFIKVKVETNKSVTLALPVITQMKYALRKDSVFIGGVNQSFD